MDKVQKIRGEVERLQDLTMDENKNFYSEAAEGEYNALCNIEHFIDSLQEEPVAENLEEAAFDYAEACKYEGGDKLLCVEHFKAGAEWKKNHLWKDAQGDDLPIIDREVIALLSNGKVVFAHRPYKGKYLGKNLTTGNIETFENKVYDKGGWNQPDVKYWLDCFFPNIEED